MRYSQELEAWQTAASASYDSSATAAAAIDLLLTFASSSCKVPLTHAHFEVMPKLLR